jgi:PKD repeat protein
MEMGPQLNMNDSTLRQPLVWPKISTTYKIIIADSSGCGKADTAFKEISVRKPLKISLAYSDTMICNNSKLQIPVKFSGGDSTNYHWQLFIKADTLSGKWKTEDTIHLVPFIDSTGFQKLTFVLNDGCTNKADTAYLTIGQRKPITITTNYRDTNLCTGNVLNYRATAKGGVPKQYRYQWSDLLTNSIISAADTLKILTKKSLKIQLIVNDGCEALGDTAEFDINVKSPLKAITNLRDTTICEGKSLNYTAKATGGNSKSYKFYWVLNDKQIDTINYLQLTLNNTSSLLLITKDNCSPSDTTKKTITVNPSPKAEFTWDLACSRTITKFEFTGTKPSSPISTQFHWNFNNESTSTLENPSYKFTSTGISTTTLILASDNGCSDTVKKTIEIKPQASADFTTADGCETDSASFKNLSQDATSYLWKFGDGQKSTKTNPKHKYQIASTTTYNVTLVAQVTNGCADSISKALTINQNPSSDFSYTYNGNKVDLKIAKGGNSYQWKFGTTDSLKTTATTYTHTIISSDQYTVCLTTTDVSGCSSQTCKNISAGVLTLSEKRCNIYPNPNNGMFTIEIENPETDVSIEVFDAMGNRINTIEISKTKSLYNVCLTVSKGVYLVRVKNGESFINQKVLVNN